VNVELITVLHLKSFWRVRWLDARALKEKSARSDGLALAFAEGSHEFLELGGPLDLEEDLVVVIGNLDVEMLGVCGRLGGGAGRATVLMVGRHFVLGRQRAS
jgi:hypothetical protein